ncbi:predicted protein [Plenodomus lingam JN3]|uniref:Predicted protein n=1 Tax=Leptosphaeria maculans (strain JN3 / isolate v23.1.3 / race Av1-4-5-6-7-8) TaxID=985895 RepID=E4ZQZ0_LEPMJ|nr:predicted protein [Plenodomus lingam JN3]CBX93655.1 predicted protein [Plenodomus lingam JN3]
MASWFGWATWAVTCALSDKHTSATGRLPKPYSM